MQQQPLNQVYKQHITLQQRPDTNAVYEQARQLAVDNGFVRQGDGSPKGRNYDLAVLVTLAGGGDAFRNKDVLEVGGRDGLFGSFVARYAPKSVVVSDYFEEWGKGTEHDLGSFEYWQALWRRAAGAHQSLLTARFEDATRLSFADNSFDIVVASSVIEHIYNQSRHPVSGAYCGDVVAMREMVRVCRPGGLILLSTDMIGGGKCARWHSGTFYYDEGALHQRLLSEPCVGTGKRLQLLDDGRTDFDFDSPHCTDIHDHGSQVHPVSGVVFGVRVLLDN